MTRCLNDLGIDEKMNECAHAWRREAYHIDMF